MKLKITLEKMPAWKQDFLDADFHFFKADCKFELCQAIEKITKSRSLGMRILRMIKKASKFADITLDSFLNNLKALQGYNVFEYRITHVANKSVVELDVNDDYFVAVEMIRKSNPLIRIGHTKDNFKKHLEKNLKKTYTKELKMEEI